MGNTRLYPLRQLQIWSSVKCGLILLLSLLSGALKFYVVVPVRVSCMGRIDLFKNYLY